MKKIKPNFLTEPKQKEIRKYLKLLRKSPKNASLHNNLGFFYRASENLEKAKQHFLKAIALNPEFDLPRINLGALLCSQRQFDEGIKHLQEACRLNPNNFEAHMFLGTALKKLWKMAPALEAYHKACCIEPKNPEIYAELGLVFMYLDKPKDAISHFEEAIKLDPNMFAAYNNLAILLLELGFVEASKRHIKKAIEINPDSGAAYAVLADCIWKQGNIDKAIELYDKSFVKNPNLSKHSYLHLLNYTDLNPKAIFEKHVSWGDLIPISLTKPKRYTNEILKIGYVSADFRKHSVGYFIKPILQNHRFQTYCYSDVKYRDRQTEEFQAISFAWRDIVAKSNDEVAEMIRQDQIDILVDLTGHAPQNRLLVFAQKPARIQITYLGYPNTTGLKTMDYRITDAWADPIGQSEHLHTETLLRTPNCFLCYTPLENAPVPEHPPIYRKRFCTFGSFNMLAKVNQNVIRVWAEILKKVSTSELIIKNISLQDQETRDHYLELFKAHGIDPNRIRLMGYIQSSEGHLEFYNEVDIALDTFPYNGTTTTCESLWMGVPVITLCGDRHASRVGVSILSDLGLDGFIAYSQQEYVELAVELANKAEILSEIRQTLRPHMKSSRLCNGQMFTQNLEDIYKKIYEQYE